MVVAAIIQARMTSTRFPGKVLKPLAGKPVLWHIIYRLRKCSKVDKIVLAITTNKTDDPLEEYASKEGIEVFRGSEENVLERYYYAAKKVKADIIVRVTGDAPLIDPEWLDYLVEILIKMNVEYVMGDPSYPSIHEGFSPFTYSALEKLFNQADNDPIAREHVTGYFKYNPGFVSSTSVIPILSHQFEGARMSVDTPADLRFLEEIYRHLQVSAGDANINDVVKLLREKPDLLLINSYVYQKKADDKTYRILFYCENEEQGKQGSGYIDNCIKLAQELRDKFGFGINFAMTSGIQERESVRNAGFQIVSIKPIEKEEWLDCYLNERKPDVIVFDYLGFKNKVLEKKICDIRFVSFIVIESTNNDALCEICECQLQESQHIRRSELSDGTGIKKIVQLIREKRNM